MTDVSKTNETLISVKPPLAPRPSAEGPGETEATNLRNDIDGPYVGLHIRDVCSAIRP